ncbi:MAG: 4Fe-4S dicluster domain-containing protein [Deltaproteobacteria bacterium]|nr:4Fe-4S dicluster domain-containing protein [Deltaproteobacteria bacterium]
MQMIDTEKVFEYSGYKKEDFSVCLGCKICASVCTLNDIGENVNPQEILISIFLGKVLNTHPLVRLCTSCYRCTDSCPWSIRIPEVIRALKEISQKEESFGKAFRSSIKIFGRIYEPYVILKLSSVLLRKGYIKFFPKWIEYFSLHLPHFVRRD